MPEELDTNVLSCPIPFSPILSFCLSSNTAGTKSLTSKPLAIPHSIGFLAHIIPHDFGRNRPTLIDKEVQLKAEMDLVETLGNMQISVEILTNTEYPEDRQGNAIHPLDAPMQPR